ncbi:hypothetical protein [Zhongshania aliphaticivorans]|uniref:hypothetical protein n=1 Tax=Zhongshania aliphaticivorans TaxID=1470434 RepID=UPI0011808F55|nr:hypothetical protein [Zhongshania aliphaticivorans]
MMDCKHYRFSITHTQKDLIMYKKMIVIFAVALLLLKGSLALSAESVETAAADYVANLLANDSGYPIGDPQELQENIVKLYGELEGVGIATTDQIDAFVKSLGARKLLDKKVVRKAFWSLISTSTEGTWGDRQALAIFLLHPYAMESGACSVDKINPSAINCAFAIEPREASVALKVGGQTLELDSNSDLAYILAINPDDSSASASSTGYTNYNDGDGSSDYVNVSDCYNYDYWWAYSYKWESNFGGIKAWAEALAFAKLQLFTNMADTAFLNIPIGLRCNWLCTTSFLVNCLDKVVANDTSGAVQCLASHVSKEGFSIHKSGSYHQHVTAAGRCLVEQATATSRPHFKAYQEGTFDGDYELPPEVEAYISKGDLKFGTNHQVAAAEDLSYSGRSIYPLPTRAALANIALPLYTAPLAVQGYSTWTHDFSRIAGWDFNIIFNAQDALPSSLDMAVDGKCETVWRHPSDSSLYARGDQFQIFHGPSYALGQFDVIVGWHTYHPVYACTDNFL